MTISTIKDDIERFRQLASDLGVQETKAVKANEIVVADWVRLKCQYGCNGYGRTRTCPPYTPTPEQFRKILKDYHWTLLLKFKPQRSNRETTHEIIAKLEKEIFLTGYYSAFGMAGGPCPHCEECNLKKCVHPTIARPSMEACGIDVYSTVNKAGFKLKVVTNLEQAPTYFGLILIR